MLSTTRHIPFRDLHILSEKGPFLLMTMHPYRKSQNQSDKTKCHIIVDYTTITDRRRTVSSRNDNHPTGVVKPVNGIQSFPLIAKYDSYRRDGVKSQPRTFLVKFKAWVVMILNAIHQSQSTAKLCFMCLLAIWNRHRSVISSVKWLNRSKENTRRKHFHHLCAFYFTIRPWSNLTRFPEATSHASKWEKLTSMYLNFLLKQKKKNKKKKKQKKKKKKQKYRGMFETQKSRNKTGSGEIGLFVICKSQIGTGLFVRRSKRPLLACRTRCKCSMETSRSKVKSKIRL